MVSFHFFEHFHLTMPKPAYGRQGLEWIVGPGYSLWCSEPTKLWKPTKNHEKPYNHLEKPWTPTKTMKNHETTLKNHGNQPKTMKKP